MYEEDKKKVKKKDIKLNKSKIHCLVVGKGQHFTGLLPIWDTYILSAFSSVMVPEP